MDNIYKIESILNSTEDRKIIVLNYQLLNTKYKLERRKNNENREG